MLNLRFKSKAKATGQRRPVHEMAPWATPFTPELVLDKDGSLLTVYEFTGVDADDPRGDEGTTARYDLDRACKSFDNRVTAWWRVSKRRVHDYIDGDFAAESDRRIDELNRRAMSSGKYFRNAHSVALAFTPETGLDKIFDKVAYHVTVGGKSLPKALFETAKDVVFARSAYAFDLERTRADVKRFESMLDAFKGGMSRLRFSRLKMQDLMVHLHQTANPSVPKRRIRFPVTLLDTHLTESEVTPGASKLLFESAHGSRYAAIIAVKEWLGFSEASLDVLNAVDAEMDICVMYRFLDNVKSSAYVEKIRRFYKMASFNLWAIVKAFVAKEEQKNDKGREQLATEAEEALSKITADGQQHGWVNVSIVVYGDTEVECDEAVKEVVGAISNAGFGAVQEKVNLFAAWASTLPGQWKEQKRLQFVETPVVSDIAPLLTVGAGPISNAWLTQQSGQAQPPLTCLPTRHRTQQRVDLHHPGGKGHLLVLGPIGAGKSIFLNFLMSQAGRHNPRRIRFDKGRSTRIPTVMAGGQFIDVTGKYKAATRVNPLSLLADPRHHGYLADWIQLAIEGEGDYALEPAQETQVFERVQLLAGYGREKWTLTFLSTLLDAELRERLQVWTRGGKNGQFFDNTDDAFEMTDDLSIEMGELFDHHPQAAALFMDLAFYRITDWLDGRYTIIEVEEAGFFFLNPKFYQRLEVWAVTIRKSNAVLAMATQSLAQVARIANFEVLKENIPNIIYLPNKDARINTKLYADTFGLTQTQIQMISDAVPNRDYLLVTPTMTRMLQVTFDKETLAYLRSDGFAQNAFDRHFESGVPEWRDNYVREMLAQH
ncbi:type IV secretion system protein TrbE (plasmid) [Pararobbsia alpina]|uniref:VirB4 family type IV secretion system protein n=1 Tax=Pararobbsia alpina TaxID=621374 RepID=UPI0039A711E6